MPSREEVRGGIEHLLATFTGEGDFTTELLDYLHSVGVVRKVDRELPVNPYKTSPLYSLEVNEENATRGGGYGVCQVHMEEAGYVAVESLI